MDNGHPWSSIQEYTLSEIGIFLKVIVRKELANKADSLTQLWLSNNLKYKGLQDILKELREKINPPTAEQKEAEIQNNWKKLASISQR